ncbi:hypothetical protein QFZ33_002309 [Arthrobacter globiformis]|nr:hypothetical protein [Arthrobacter globiformis]
MTTNCSGIFGYIKHVALWLVPSHGIHDCLREGAIGGGVGGLPVSYASQVMVAAESLMPGPVAR